MLLWRLILALLLSDFVLQFNWIIRHKGELKGLLVHGLIYTAVSLLLVIDILTPELAYAILVLVVVHLVTDVLKDGLKRCCKPLEWLWFILDQVVHIATIVIAVGIVTNDSNATIRNFLAALNGTDLMKYACLLIVNLAAGMFFTERVSSRFRPEGEDESKDGPHALIGLFERFLITVSVLIGRFEIIGFLIAAKSILRLPDASSADGKDTAKTHKMVNYYLIGTFVSYSWAIAFSILFIKLVR